MSPVTSHLHVGLENSAHAEAESKPGCFSVNQLLGKIQFTGDTICTAKRAGRELGQGSPLV